MVTFDFAKTPITQIADYIIVEAAKKMASDVHFDPRDNGLMVRIRVDGELHDYTFIPKAYERNLLTRLKLLANMNITETRLPQDGAIKGNYGGRYLDMRASCLPTNEGEKIVIRILDFSKSLDGLQSLGFTEDNFRKLERMIASPNGIILVTGATGTGKSTTVYSILQALNKEETNIITVEDPIEMNIEGMNQVQVNSDIGLDFATVLRSVLRQDPNIILIGEIRDSETAKIAVRASITGHLVLSTIHTNNSLATIERLLDMDVERYLLSSALTGVISQRLTKMLCPQCKFRRKTTMYEKKIFKSILGKEIDEVADANPDGCPSCHNGYKGRLAIHEVLEINDEIRNAMNEDHLTREELRTMVFDKNNVITLLQDGLMKVLEERTSFEEIYKTIEIDSSEGIDHYKAELAESTKQRIEELSKKEAATVAPATPVTEPQNTEVKQAVVTPVPGVNIVPPVEQVPATNINAQPQANTQNTTTVPNPTPQVAPAPIAPTQSNGQVPAAVPTPQPQVQQPPVTQGANVPLANVVNPTGIVQPQ